MKNNHSTIFFLTVVCFFSASVFAESLSKITENDIIKFAAYDDFPPYSYAAKDGKAAGIDIDIGKALAMELGVTPVFRLVFADESLEDDLRVYVWKGHHVTGPPADVMLHVPYDQNLIKKEDKVSFIAPYSEEQVVVAADTDQLGNNPQIMVFTTNKVGVERVTMADGYLLGAFQGRFRNSVVHFQSIPEATQALINKEVTAVMGARTEIEAGLGKAKDDYQIGLMAMPGIAAASWDLGLAVKSSNKDLSKALEVAMDKLIADGSIKKIFNKHGTSYHAPAARINY
ncbi:MAG: amino acid ABC transporter substrate-binding protein [Gammaproteobacteria bacterium]|nr:MAG: amino acid ABC transporter substrate-binding protein [Gammaproteobacteria bacterium]